MSASLIKHALVYDVRHAILEQIADSMPDYDCELISK